MFCDEPRQTQVYSNQPQKRHGGFHFKGEIPIPLRLVITELDGILYLSIVHSTHSAAKCEEPFAGKLMLWLLVRFRLRRPLPTHLHTPFVTGGEGRHGRKGV